jgi:uncharacterized membrane protein
LKYSGSTGIVAALLLIFFCFLPWAFYPDLQENFTGFYSNHNHYGKPGKAFSFLAIFSIVLFLLPKIWARWVNQVVGVVLLAYAIKTYVLFSSCYNTICPQVKFALPAVLASALIILVCSLLSRSKGI